MPAGTRTRVYFNRHADAPLIWSFDHGDMASETKVAGFELHNIHLVSADDPLVPRGDTERPKVWMELLDVVWYEVREDIAHFYG